MGTWGASGSVGNITWSGSFSANSDLTVGAVLSVGAVSTSAVAAGTITVVLSDSTTIGTTMTGGAGVDKFTGTGGADTMTGAGGADSLTGGSGADTITGGEGADTVVGGAGADSVVLTETAAAADVVVLAGAAASNTSTDIDNTVTGFAVANDVIDLTNNAAKKHGGGALTGYVEAANLGNIADAKGLAVFGENITVSGDMPTEAEIETYLADSGSNHQVFFVDNVDQAVYIAADDGTDTYIMELNSSGTNKLFTAAEDVGVTILKIVGLSDATQLSAANFSDFS